MDLMQLAGTLAHSLTSSPMANRVLDANTTAPGGTQKTAAPKDTSTSTSTTPSDTTTATAPVAPPTADATISGAQTALDQQLQTINPMAMQLFTQQILMPWMQQIAGMTTKANKEYAKSSKDIAGQPGMQGYAPAQMQLAQVPQEQLGASNLTNAYLGAAAAAPAQQVQQTAMQQIQSLLGQLIPQERQIAGYYDPSYQVLAGQAASGGVGGLGAAAANPYGL